MNAQEIKAAVEQCKADEAKRMAEYYEPWHEEYGGEAEEATPSWAEEDVEWFRHEDGGLGIYRVHRQWPAHAPFTFKVPAHAALREWGGATD